MPEYRTSTRPLPFRVTSADLMACWISGIWLRSGLCFTFPFHRICGTAVIAFANSDSGFPVRFISERICNAEIKPSPVVLWSRKIKWPDCSF